MNKIEAKRARDKQYWARNKEAIAKRRSVRYKASRKEVAVKHAAYRKEHPEQEAARYQRRKRDIREVIGKRLRQAKERAQKLNVPFDLTYAYLNELYDQHPRCSVSELPFDLSSKANTISLHRLEPAKGYVVGNVRFVLFIVNCALGDWGEGPLSVLVAALHEQNV